MRQSAAAWSALAVSMLAACGGAEAGPAVGRPAPEYVAATLDGDSVSLSSLRGEVVLLNFWATWCAPCRAETPFLQSLYEEHAEQGFRVVGISMDTGDAADQVADFVEEYEVGYTVLHDPRMRGMELYRIIGLPATFLIDREGVIRWMMYGPVSETNRSFMDAVSEALG